MLANDSDNILAYKASRQLSHGPFGFSLTLELDKVGLLQSNILFVVQSIYDKAS